MDLNERIDRLEGELKIIKNEVKQVLLDIKEQILSTYANPFPREIQITEKPAAKLGQSGAALGRERVAEKEGVVEAKQEQPGGVGGGSPVAPAQGGVGGQPQQVGAGPLPASAGAISGHFIPEQGIGKEDLEGRISSPLEGTPEPGEGEATTPPKFREERPILGKRPVEKTPPAQRKETHARRLPLRSRSEAESEAIPGEGELDLAMVIRLARWAEESVKKVGKEKVERLLEIYQGTKYLSQRAREIILGLVHLVDEEKPEGQVTIRSCIGMLLQLDSILGGNYRKEQALLSLLLDNEEGELWTKL